jgi:hypothetical protein
MTTKIPTDSFVTEPARLSFPSLFKKRARTKEETDPEKFTFQAAFLLPPTTNLSPILAAMRAAMQAKWNKVLRPEELKDFPLKRAEEREHLDGYLPGWHFLTTNNSRRPAVVDRDGRTPITDEERIYAGCWVRGFLTAWCWTFSGKKGVSLSLDGVQFLRDDEPFGGNRAGVAREAFEALGPVGDDDAPDAGRPKFDFSDL